mgnify:CR=1 FL=1
MIQYYGKSQEHLQLVNSIINELTIWNQANIIYFTEYFYIYVSQLYKTFSYIFP